MSKQKNVYPDWAEKFRGKGRTIRKVKDGYGLYECTSEYVKGGPPKAKQKYLGMITEKDGFIPKKTGDQGPVYLEYSLSRLIALNFRREVMRHVFQCSEDLFRIGIIEFIFGSSDSIYLQSSYLTYSEAARLSELREKVSDQKIQRISSLISDTFDRKITEEKDRQIIKGLMLLCVVESGPRSVRKPEIPKDVMDILEKYGLKYSN